MNKSVHHVMHKQLTRSETHWVPLLICAISRVQAIVPKASTWSSSSTHSQVQHHITSHKVGTEHMWLKFRLHKSLFEYWIYRGICPMNSWHPEPNMLYIAAYFPRKPNVCLSLLPVRRVRPDTILACTGYFIMRRIAAMQTFLSNLIRSRMQT